MRVRNYSRLLEKVCPGGLHNPSVSGFTTRNFFTKTKSTMEKHYVLGTTIDGTIEGAEEACFGLGCFWGAERKFWQTKGVVSTAVGYRGGNTPDPSYSSVCSGSTYHAEIVRVLFDPTKVSYGELLHVFWGNHDPTQVDRQGNDRGTQYRSIIFYYNDQQKHQAEASKEAFERALRAKGYDKIATQIQPADKFPLYYAEDYHQQYLAKNPGGYCGLRGTGCYEPNEINRVL
jgi:peptide-methionine (S)-S-oxide reductase